jgi:hypothetical protein
MDEKGKKEKYRWKGWMNESWMNNHSQQILVVPPKI